MSIKRFEPIPGESWQQTKRRQEAYTRSLMNKQLEKEQLVYEQKKQNNFKWYNPWTW